MMGLAALVGAALADSASFFASWLSLTYGFITGFTLTAASMVINDYYDRKTDEINEPNRPIPSGAVKPSEALVFAVVLSGIGFAAAFLTNPVCLLAAVIAWSIAVAYTSVGKRSGLPGNFLVSAVVSVPFIYGSLALLGTVKLNGLFFAAMVFLSITGREITKGIVDVEGDKTQGVKTIAVRYGERNAAIAATVFYVSAVALTPIPWFSRIVSVWFLPFAAITDIGLVVSSLLLLKDHSRENARKIKNVVLIWFLFGFLAFAVSAV